MKFMVELELWSIFCWKFFVALFVSQRIINSSCKSGYIGTKGIEILISLSMIKKYTQSFSAEKYIKIIINQTWWLYRWKLLNFMTYTWYVWLYHFVMSCIIWVRIMPWILFNLDNILQKIKNSFYHNLELEMNFTLY